MENIKKEDCYTTKAVGGGGSYLFVRQLTEIRQLSNQQECVLSVQLFHGGGGVSE